MIRKQLQIVTNVSNVSSNFNPLLSSPPYPPPPEKKFPPPSCVPVLSNVTDQRLKDDHEPQLNHGGPEFNEADLLRSVLKLIGFVVQFFTNKTFLNYVKHSN